MAVAVEIAGIEQDLSRAGKTVKDLCAAAGVNRSTWTRWKAGATEPNMATWRKVQAELQALVAPISEAS